MEQLINILEKAPNALKPLFGTGVYLSNSTVGRNLIELVFLRVSQMNGCAFCIDLHYKKLLSIGESEQRLYSLISWRDTDFYDEREKAALALAEAITYCDVPEKIYKDASRVFSDVEMVDLTIAATTINTWNRINEVFVRVPEKDIRPAYSETHNG